MHVGIKVVSYDICIIMFPTLNGQTFDTIFFTFLHEKKSGILIVVLKN